MSHFECKFSYREGSTINCEVSEQGGSAKVHCYQSDDGGGKLIFDAEINSFETKAFAECLRFVANSLCRG